MTALAFINTYKAAQNDEDKMRGSSDGLPCIVCAIKRSSQRGTGGLEELGFGRPHVFLWHPWMVLIGPAVRGLFRRRPKVNNEDGTNRSVHSSSASVESLAFCGRQAPDISSSPIHMRRQV